MNAKKEIIKKIQSISGRYSPYTVFSDWIQCSALAIQNACTIPHTKLWEAREKEYLDTMNKYNEDERFAIRDLFFLLVDALEEEMTDVLGEVYMEAGMGNKYTGQFFTPFHLSELCARAAIQDKIDHFDGNTITLLEPTCGGGGMIILAGDIGDCQRPLRAQTMQGERVTLANSETIPAGSTLEFTVVCFDDKDMKLVCEWLDYGVWRGLGQWRNSGKGKFTWEKLSEETVKG